MYMLSFTNNSQTYGWYYQATHFFFWRRWGGVVVVVVVGGEMLKDVLLNLGGQNMVCGVCKD